MTSEQPTHEQSKPSQGLFARTKDAMYETWDSSGRKVVRAIPDGTVAEYYSGARWAVPLGSGLYALIDSDMLVTP